MVQADCIFTGGVVLPMTAPEARAQAIAIGSGRVLAVGSDAEIEVLAGPGTQRVALHGRCVVPGFIDAHNHMLGFGQTLRQIDLQNPPARSIAAIIERVRQAVTPLPPGTWAIGHGYDQNKLAEGRHPTREELDRAAPAHPLILGHTSGHMLVANSLALARAGITRETPDPPGGRIVRDAAGEPTGLVQELAQPLLRNAVPPPSLDDLVEALRLADARYVAEGITCQHEAGLGNLGGAGLGADGALDLRAYQQAAARGVLRVRSRIMIHRDGLSADGRTARFAPDIIAGTGDARLRFFGVKIFTDGSLIGRTAAMRAPYQGEMQAGFLVIDPEELYETVARAHAGGWRVGTHAIGDLAVQTVVEAYERVLRTLPPGTPNPRFRIEHCGLVDDDLLRRIRDGGMVPVTQPRFISELGDGFIRAVGQGRLRRCYPFRPFLDLGIPLAFSSDRPVVQGAPLLGMHDAVNRRTESGTPYAPELGVSAEQALRAYTRHAAYAAGDEADLGMLAPGMQADLVVLSADPTAVPPEEIAALRVERTVIAGETVYQADA